MKHTEQPEGSGWEINDSVLKEVAELPIRDITIRARDGDLVSLNYLWSTFVKGSLFARSAKACSQLGHRGRLCDGSVCTEAFGSALETGARMVLGMKYNLATEPTRELAFRRLDEPDSEMVRATTIKTVLRYWDADLVNGQDPTEVWLKQVNFKLKRGFATEVRRVWNQTRGLAIRIDQANYLSRTGTDATSDFFEHFLDQWSRVLGLAGTGDSSDTSRGSELREAAVALEFVEPSRTALLRILRHLYNDACDNTYEDCNVDVERVVRAVTSDASGSLANVTLRTETMAVFCLALESCLGIAYESMGLDEHVLVTHLHSARDCTRKIPRASAGEEQIERTPRDWIDEFFIETDNDANEHSQEIAEWIK